MSWRQPRPQPARREGGGAAPRGRPAPSGGRGEVSAGGKCREAPGSGAGRRRAAPAAPSLPAAVRHPPVGAAPQVFGAADR